MPHQAAGEVHLGNLVIDFDRADAWVEGWPVGLTYFELELLTMLARQAGKLVSREKLSSILSLNPATENSTGLNVHICRLRRKIRNSYPWEIITVRRRGYMLQTNEQTGNSVSRRGGEHTLTRSMTDRGTGPHRQTVGG